MWLNIGVALLVLLICCIATFVIIRNQNSVNRTFAIFAYATGLWIIANFIGANYKSHAYARYFIHADFALGTVVALTFWYFTATLLRQTRAPKKLFDLREKLRPPFSVLTLTAIIVSLSTWCVSIQASATGTLSIDYNSGYTIYAAILGAILLWGCITIGLTLRYATGSFRGQVVIISRGLVAGVVFVAAANLILPQLTNSPNVNLIAGNLSYLGLVALIVATSYAVVRHKLFDLRFFVVRATAYAFTVGLITIFYLAPSIWLISRIVHVHISGYELLGLVTTSLVLTVVYRYLRRWFDKLTNKIFFRNFYVTQDVLDQLSDLLVRTIDADQIQQGSRRILLGALHASSLTYWLEGTTDEKNLKRLQGLFRTGDSVVVLDELEGENAKLSEIAKQEVALAVQLRTTHGELGYLTLGYKASGQGYTVQDRRLLSTAADEIAISMQNALHFEEIQNFNKSLQENVNDATRKLRKSNEKLQALDATKDEFITMASHQLRTPLTSVKGYLSMVIEGDAGKLNDQQKQLLTQSYASAQRMVYLISDLLNLSRLNTGKFVIEPSSVDLREVIQAEIDQVAETAKSREVSITYKSPGSFPKLMLDETKIHQVVMNFIDNAIYYTPPGGKIVVSLTETPTAVEYRVKDNGIGVPRAVQHRLFSKFYRAENAQRARPDGTGLGLFMAKKVIVAQGGSIIFESTENKGSIFGFRFTKAKHVAPEPESR